MLAYFIGMPILIAFIAIGALMPFIFIVHDVLRYGKWGWNKPDDFTWKGQTRFYIILTVLYYAILLFLYFKTHEVVAFLFVLFCTMFYGVYVAEDSDNPNKKVQDNTKE
jgi:Ca2+/H+ antiporter